MEFKPENFFFLADDLTGAGDIGVQLRKYYENVNIYTAPVLPPTGTIAIYDSETRYSGADIRGMLDIYEDIRKDKSIIYKKIDSTLRGNIREEISYFTRMYPDMPVFFIPMFPEMGRKCINGVYYINNIPLSDTEFTLTDNPPLSEKPADYCPEGYTHTDINDFDIDSSDKTFITSDASDDDDMQKISSIILDMISTDRRILICGSAGMLKAMLETTGGKSLPETSFNNSDVKRQTLFISGSRHSTNRNIAEHPLYTKVIIDETELIENPDYFADIKLKIRKGLMFGKNIAVIPRGEVALRGRKIGVFEERLADLFKNVYRLAPGIVLSGGATAFRCLTTIDCINFSVRSIVDTGIPVLFSNNTCFIIKPGGFGHSGLLDVITEEY